MKTLKNQNIYSQIETDIDYENDINPDFNFLEDGWEKWKIGDKIGWLYKEDLDFYMSDFKKEIKDKDGIKEWLNKNYGFPYTGILFTLPEERFNIENNVIICMDTYPVEKENCVCDWISLIRLIDKENKDLYKVWKI